MAPGTNRISTGAFLAGDGLLDTLYVPSALPVLASTALMASPASPKSDARTVLESRIRSMPLWMAIPCGYGAATLTFLMGASFVASPTIIVDVPMQLKYQNLPSSENTMSSPTLQPGTGTTLLMP